MPFALSTNTTTCTKLNQFMEPSSWPENLPTHRKKAIQKLIQGRDFTIQLQAMLSKPNLVDNRSSLDQLMAKISGSFTDTLSILNFHGSDEASQIPAGSPSWDGRKCEDSGESSKISAVKDRRGCYKRRKTSETYEKFTSDLIDDGHAWRKYGQKSILNSIHPRNYYRCTHKFEQGCKATKQVQRTEDDPPMYRTTYHGHHSCRNLLKAPQIILDNTTTSTCRDSSILLSFESKGVLEKKPDDPYFATIKHEDNIERLLPGCLDHNHQSSSLSLSYDYLFTLPDANMTTFNPMLSSGSDVMSSGVYSCTTTSSPSNELDMNIMVGNVNFDDDFHFEFSSY